MGDILEEASALVRCKECPWYKTCVVPMRITPEDIRKQLSINMAGAEEAGFAFGAGQSFPKFLADLASAAQSLLLEGCPIFIERLRASPKLAERIKKIMQTWGLEDKE